MTVNSEARGEAERLKQEALSEVDQLINDPKMQREWVRQDNLIYGGLMGVGIVMVQPFLIADSLDRSATIAVVAWSVAIPLLAALLLVNRHETFRRRRTDSRTVLAAGPVAQLSAFVGLVAGFWHIHWVAGTVMLVSSIVAMGVHSAGVTRLEFGKPARQEVTENSEESASETPEEPGDAR